MLAPIDAGNQLKNVGDFILHESPEGIPLLTICVKIESYRKFLPDWQIQMAQRAGSPFSWEVQNPILETFTKESFPKELAQNEDLMYSLIRGTLFDLEEAGFTGNLADIDLSVNCSKKSLEIVNSLLDSADFNDGEMIYYTSRALIAQALLDPQLKQKILDTACIIKKRDWIPTIISSSVAQAMFGDDVLRESIFEKAKDWSEGDDRRFVKIIAGWSMLSSAAKTEEERQEAYDILMKDIDTNYITMSGNVIIALAILANEDQKNNIFELALKKKDSRYWEIAGGGLLAMAITSSEGSQRSEVFQMAKQEVARNVNHLKIKYYFLAMALSAQTQEERLKTLKILEIYTENTRWRNMLKGWAYIALGVLGCTEYDRDFVIRSVAAAMESSR